MYGNVYLLVGATVEKTRVTQVIHQKLSQPNHNTSCRETEREEEGADPERVNLCPLMVKPCALRD